jgi:hypothetical protein
MPNFTQYSKRRRRAWRGADVTVMRGGYLSFSADAWAAAGSPADVKFLVGDDREHRRVIGFAGCESGEPGANSVNPVTRVVTAFAVLNQLGHDLRAPGRRHALHLEDGQPPYIDLDEVITAADQQAS